MNIKLYCSTKNQKLIAEALSREYGCDLSLLFYSKGCNIGLWFTNNNMYDHKGRLHNFGSGSEIDKGRSWAGSTKHVCENVSYLEFIKLVKNYYKQGENSSVNQTNEKH